MMQLSPKQAEVVRAPLGQAILVEAAAGSGKTRVLTERVRFILESTRRDGVIALTFTNRAADEMRGRLDDIDDLSERCWIATIHSVAQRVLNQYGHTIGLPSDLHIYERDQDRKAVLIRSIIDSGRGVNDVLDIGDDSSTDRNKVIQNYLDQFSIIKRELLTEEETRLRYSADDSFWSIFTTYQDALLESGGIDFDDILVYAHRILLEQPWCREIYLAKYQHICVDEAQDLNRAQYEFIKALCGEDLKSLLLVGDSDQMIYGFNSSSADFMCRNFDLDFSPLKFSLRENYRSSRAVISLANKLKPGAQELTAFVLAGHHEIREFANEDEESNWIVTSIQSLLTRGQHPEIEGQIDLAKMVVIARNRFVFSTLEKKLTEAAIPYSLKKGERSTEPDSLIGRALDLAIRIRINPRDWVDGRKLCQALKIKEQYESSDDVLNIVADTVQQSVVPNREILSSLLRAISLLDIEQPNIPKLCSEIIKNITEIAKTTDKANLPELERAIQEVNDFLTAWTTFRRKGLGETLAAFRNAIALGQVNDDPEISGLVLSTVHTMKGLERDIVFLMGMCEGVFPDYRAKTQKTLAEELNSAFVAITRAKRWIYITYPRSKVMPWGDSKNQAASRFVSTLRS
ncbi:ATP-dependent helicase [Achromobacter sp. UMC46]|uniref:ATP-dependent helicase n=2 Tax=Burkholderiales TaxID=80840 RepID=UPI0015FFB64D|nr:ATP-dependent helicase [Achromobacter sp. UMC46]